MFTGLIEHIGTVVAVAAQALAIDLGPLAAGAAVGDSIAVAGCCLTVSALGPAVGVGADPAPSIARFDVAEETLRKTTIGTWAVGRRVNLERALALGDRLGGHLVAGHVDGVGHLVERRPEGGSERFTIALPASVRVIEKGSLAIDGTSLTTWECGAGRCTVALIPHTLAHTTLGGLRPGAPVNLEQDLIGRWIEAMAAPYHRT